MIDSTWVFDAKGTRHEVRIASERCNVNSIDLTLGILGIPLGIPAYDTCVNGKGRLCSMTDASGSTTYEYTPKGQVKKETKSIDSIQYITQYTYDQNGNMKTMTYPSGKVITYNYTNDRATSVLNGAANIATSIAYKPFGGMSAITYGNGLTGTTGYDTQYRLATLATGTFQSLTYGYDNNGNITSIAPGKTYTYDDLDRLGTATGTWGSLGWTYDGVGNRLTENANTYIYNTNTNKLASANGITFGYDNNGNTTTEASRTYTYNQNQRLIQVTEGAMNAGYAYNGNGQRVKKNVNGMVTIFHYSQNGQIIAESNSSGTITAEYVYLNGQPLGKMEGANAYYYHNDHLGTPQKMTDASGTVVWAADYKPFGEAAIDQNVTTITNNLRFPGQYFDAETGLNYNYYRDYNPVVGKYIEADPLGIKRSTAHLVSNLVVNMYVSRYLKLGAQRGMLGGLNSLYNYANGNSLKYIDELGLFALDPILKAILTAPSLYWEMLMAEQALMAVWQAANQACDTVSTNSDKTVPLPFLSAPNSAGGMTGFFLKVHKDCKGECTLSFFLGDVYGDGDMI